MVTFRPAAIRVWSKCARSAAKFPYYGALETEPALSLESFHAGANALVDENVMLQFNAKVGDRIKVGDSSSRIAGSLRKIPGETLAFSLISPRVYIPMEYLDRTQLVQKGSCGALPGLFQVRRRNPESNAGEQHRAAHCSACAWKPTRSASAPRRSPPTWRICRATCAWRCLSRCCSPVSASPASCMFTPRKRRAAALLRCIGATPRETVSVYLLQILLLTVVCSAAGVGLGVCGADLFAVRAQRFSAGGDGDRDLAPRDRRRGLSSA